MGIIADFAEKKIRWRPKKEIIGGLISNVGMWPILLAIGDVWNAATSSSAALFG
jgi:hypothetical protein